MKVLVIGGGGREHALVWAIARSPRVREIVCAPGNGGIAAHARCVPVNQKDLDDMVRVAVAEQPELIVVGPEVPLSLGLVDELTRRGMRVFGPTRRAAMLETSKVFAKEFMQRHHLPTAHYAVCGSVAKAHEALAHFHAPIVVKADGLAAGKGVVICESKQQAEAVVKQMLAGQLLGEAQHQVLLEEHLTGEEISWLVLSDGAHVLPLVAAQDHKRIGEGDTGANTGGMGAYSTDTLLAPEMRDWLVHHIAKPTVEGMAAEGVPFRGVLYCGLMMTARGPMLLEFNARFGDPETEAILPRLRDGELLRAMEAAVDGRLDQIQLEWRSEPAVTVIAASKGYPGGVETGHEIRGLEQAANAEGVTVFHAGTALRDGKLVTAGGRVLAVTAIAETLQSACDRAYDALRKIDFDGMYYRRDIAHRALKKSSTKQ
ncbi:MAG: phosphoribosylamine--glycine ligase [Acidobacteriaceae bacterium]